MDSSTSANAGQKRRARERRSDKIVGNRLSQKPAKVTRAGSVGKLKIRLTEANPSLPIDDQDDDETRGHTVKELVTLCSDLIFNPGTQTTRYSAQREAARNLRRRMPGYDIHVAYGSGEGILHFTAKSTLTVTDDDHEYSADVEAECVASPTDMAIHAAKISIDGRVFDIEPADHAMYPEEAVTTLQRIVFNLVHNNL